MAKRKTPKQVYDALDKAESRLARAFKAWTKARDAVRRLDAKRDKEWAGKADVAELAEARLGARVQV